MDAIKLRICLAPNPLATPDYEHRTELVLAARLPGTYDKSVWQMYCDEAWLALTSNSVHPFMVKDTRTHWNLGASGSGQEILMYVLTGVAGGLTAEVGRQLLQALISVARRASPTGPEIGADEALSRAVGYIEEVRSRERPAAQLLASQRDGDGNYEFRFSALDDPCFLSVLVSSTGDVVAFSRLSPCEQESKTT